MQIRNKDEIQIDQPSVALNYSFESAPAYIGLKRYRIANAQAPCQKQL